MSDQTNISLSYQYMIIRVWTGQSVDTPDVFLLELTAKLMNTFLFVIVRFGFDKERTRHAFLSTTKHCSVFTTRKSKCTEG